MHVAMRVGEEENWRIRLEPNSAEMIEGIQDYFWNRHDGDLSDGPLEVLTWEGEPPECIVEAIHNNQVSYDGMTHEERLSDEDPVLRKRIDWEV